MNAVTATSAHKQPDSEQDYITNTASDHPTSGGSTPTAHYYNGSTYFTYLGGCDDYFDPFAMSYDHATGTVNGPVHIGDNPLADVEDGHSVPAIIVDDDGYIHVIYGGHGHYRGRQTHAVSRTPEDISSWEILDNIDPETTYPSFIKKRDGTLYLFYRAGNHRDDWVYVTSTDNGRTFSDPTAFASAGNRRHGLYGHDVSYEDSWYLSFYKGRNGSIHVTGLYHACHDSYSYPLENMPEPRHGYNRFGTYYLRMNPDETWENAAGESIDVPFDKTLADEKLRLYDTGPDYVLAAPRMGYHDVGGSNSNTAHGVYDTPHLVFPTRNGMSGGFTFARWGGDSWEIHEEGTPWGPMFMKSPQDIRIYQSDRVAWGGPVNDSEPDSGEYRSTDGGETWERVGDVQNDQLHQQTVAYNYHNDAKVMALNYSDDRAKNAQRIYLYGDSGFVRPDENPTCPE
ncbi:BNR repeat-containing protein [Halocatena marina]|nr:BNR repeat-containing protein [Halocatena marina]